MATRKTTVDQAIKGAVKEAVREAAAPGGPSPYSPEGSLLDRFVSLFNQAPTSSKYSLRLYKKAPIPTWYSGTPPALQIIKNPTDIADLEADLMRLASENHWGSGLYEWMLYGPHPESGHYGIIERTEYAVMVPEGDGGLPSKDGASRGASAFRDVTETIKAVKEVLPPSDVGGGKLAESMASVLKAGAEVARDLAPKPQSQDDAKALMPLLASIADILAKTGVIGKRETFVDQVKALQGLGLFPQAETGEGVEATASPIERVKELSELIQALQPLLGGQRGTEKPSLMEVIFTSLGPHWEGLAEKVAGAWNNTIQYKREFLAAQMARVAPPQTGAPVALPAHQQGLSLRALSAQIVSAATAENDAYFPQLAQQLYEAVPNVDPVIKALMSGQIDEDRALASLSEAGMEGVYGEPVRGYLIRFCHWLRYQATGAGGPAPPPTPPAPSAAVQEETEAPVVLGPGQIEAECQREACGLIYVFESQEQFEFASRVCNAVLGQNRCGGEIVHVRGPA